MEFRQIDATFGKLEQCKLSFSDGLTIIEAPNEAGKSTLIAFLRAMLYGLPTRERGALADKNRYAPWSLSPMRGTLSLSCRLGEITLQRDTARANSPMGRFSAVYTGSGERVEGLTAADCGEQLLGVPGEVYERSAFIRQSSMTVSQNAELERRIASLITTGEEGSSYSEVAAALKKQLNARKYNKSGRIPALEAEISALEQSQQELTALHARRHSAEETLAALSEEEASLSAQLHLHELCDLQEQQKVLAEALHASQLADAQSAQFSALLREDKTPTRETLTLARSKLLSLTSLRQQMEDAAQQHELAANSLAAFDAAAPKGRRTLLYIVSALIFAAAAALSFAYIPASALRYAVPALSLIASAFFFGKAYRAQQQSKACALTRSTLERTAQEKKAAADTQQALYDITAQELLSALSIDSLAQADHYVDTSLARWDRLAALEADARAARLRYETLAAQSSKAEAPAEPLTRPVQSRSALQSALGALAERRREAQRTIDYTDGRCRALGDPDETAALLVQKQSDLSALRAEYDAIALAMDALQSANTALQSRFSPALSRRAAELFSRLTGGRHDRVLLDRSFSALISEAGDSVSHDAQLLSLGALDQLYLAVRLAICETVLPAEDPPPLVLDDALVRFDDARCHAALDLLYEQSQTRQILLFTCQHRESSYLAGRSGVSTLTL